MGSPIGIYVSTDPCQPVLNPVCLLQGQRAEQSPHLSARHASRSRSAPRGRHLSSFLLSPTPANGQASRPHKHCPPVSGFALSRARMGEQNRDTPASAASNEIGTLWALKRQHQAATPGRSERHIRHEHHRVSH